MQLLHEIVQASEQQILFDPDARPTTKMVYPHGVTLWMLILQRLGGGKTLRASGFSGLDARPPSVAGQQASSREHALRESGSLCPGPETAATGHDPAVFRVRLQLPGANQ
jgi:hypothetical protein